MKMRRYVVTIAFVLALLVAAYADTDGFSPTSRVFVAKDDAILGIPILADNYDSEQDRWVAVHNGHISVGQGSNIAHNTDFAKDSSTSASTTNASSLRWGFKSARLRFWWDTGTTFFDVSSGTVTINDTATNYIEFNLDSNAVQVRLTRFTDSFIALHIVRRDTNRIVGETDVRWAMPVNRQTQVGGGASAISAARPDSGLANFLLTDFSKDTGATSGLNLVLKSGAVRTNKYDTVIRKDSTSLNLVGGTRNFVQMDRDGNIFSDTIRFQDTASPLLEAATSGSAIVQESSQVAWYQFPGNARIFVGLDTEKGRFQKNLSRGKDLFWATDVETLYIANAETSWKNVSLPGTSRPDTARTYNFFDSLPLITVGATSTIDSEMLDFSPFDTGVAIFISGDVTQGVAGGVTFQFNIALIDTNGGAPTTFESINLIHGSSANGERWPFSISAPFPSKALRSSYFLRLDMTGTGGGATGLINARVKVLR